MINYLVLKFYEWRRMDWAQYENSLRRQCARDIQTARNMQDLLSEKIQQCEQKQAQRLIHRVCK